MDFIHRNKTLYGVESICRVLPIAPSTYYRHAQRLKQPDLRAKRCASDELLLCQIQQVWQESSQIYGYRKVWRQLQRQGINAARCTVARLMRKHSIQGVWRGKGKRTTVCDPELQRAADLVNRQFTATRPNQLWVADFTYVTTHQGFVYTAFIIDVFALRIVGWKVANNMNTELVMDALEQAWYARNKPKHVIHHSDRGSQYLSIRYTERLRDAHVTASVGTTGDSYDNALAETVNGLYKTEVIHHQKPWKRMIDVELATLNWVDWFNHRRLLSSIGYVPPAEFETAYYRQLEESAKVA